MVEIVVDMDSVKEEFPLDELHRCLSTSFYDSLQAVDVVAVQKRENELSKERDEVYFGVIAYYVHVSNFLDQAKERVSSLKSQMKSDFLDSVYDAVDNAVSLEELQVSFSILQNGMWGAVESYNPKELQARLVTIQRKNGSILNEFVLKHELPDSCFLPSVELLSQYPLLDYPLVNKKIARKNFLGKLNREFEGLCASHFPYGYNIGSAINLYWKFLNEKIFALCEESHNKIAAKNANVESRRQDLESQRQVLMGQSGHYELKEGKWIALTQKAKQLEKSLSKLPQLIVSSVPVQESVGAVVGNDEDSV